MKMYGFHPFSRIQPFHGGQCRLWRMYWRRNSIDWRVTVRGMEVTNYFFIYIYLSQQVKLCEYNYKKNRCYETLWELSGLGVRLCFTWECYCEGQMYILIYSLNWVKIYLISQWWLRFHEWVLSRCVGVYQYFLSAHSQYSQFLSIRLSMSGWALSSWLSSSLSSSSCIHHRQAGIVLPGTDGKVR